jgi:HEAT repeat protein
MRFALLVAALFAAQAAFAVLGIETDPDKIHAQWKKEKVEALATERDAKERAAAAEWLGGRSEPDVIAALANALSDKDARVREAAASALWKSGKAAEPARAQLVAALNEANPNVLARIAGALQMLGMEDNELVPARKRVFADPAATPDSRFLVSRNLIGAEPSPLLLDAMVAYLERNAASKSDAGRRNADLAQQALVRLATRDPSTGPAMLGAARRVKAGHLQLLAAMKELKVKPAGFTQLAVDLLASPDWNVRHAALGAMRGLKDIEAWGAAAAGMLKDPDSTVRNEALWALKSAGGLAANHIDKVVEALKDPSEGVRRSAASAIGEMGDRTQAVPAALKARVAEVGRPALAAIVDSDPDREVRAEAKSALAKLDSSGPLPIAAKGNESGGMEILRQRRVSFEPSSYVRALTEVDVEVVQAFLDAGMSAKDPLLGMGPPLRVMLFGHVSCSPQERPTKPATKQLVKLLLERGADPNGTDANGNSPLMEAASHGCDRDLMRLLIKAGASVTARNAAGFTPFEAGLFHGHDGLEEIIAAGYRLPPDKVKVYEQGYAGKPAVQAMIKKAAKK